MTGLSKMASVSTIVAALAVTAPIKAEANPLIIGPWVAALVIGGAVVGGAAVGSAVTANAKDGHPAVYVDDTAPAAGNPCYYTHASVNGVWRRVQVCN